MFEGVPAETDPPDPRRRGGCAWAFVASLLILALLAAFTFHRIERLSADSAASIRDAVAAVTGMQPKVTVHEQVVFEEARPILELAVLERDTSVERETETQWLGSTMRLRVRGLFHVKVGYNLADHFTVNIAGDHGEVVQIKLPPPRVLSIEQKRLDIRTLENGLWNRMSNEDLENEVNLLRLEAHLKTNQSGTLDEAQRLLVQRLQEKLGPGRRVDILTTKPGSTPVPNPSGLP